MADLKSLDPGIPARAWTWLPADDQFAKCLWNSTKERCQSIPSAAFSDKVIFLKRAILCYHAVTHCPCLLISDLLSVTCDMFAMCDSTNIYLSSISQCIDEMTEKTWVQLETEEQHKYIWSQGKQPDFDVFLFFAPQEMILEVKVVCRWESGIGGATRSLSNAEFLKSHSDWTPAFKVNTSKSNLGHKL